MLDASALLSMRQQCALFGLNRSNLYYETTGPSPENLTLMRRMDVLHLEYPFFGSRMMTQTLKSEGHAVNRKRIQRLMNLMGLVSLAPKPPTSGASPEHPKFPYLLRNLEIDVVDQVWSSDITYIPLRTGFAYLVAMMDWYSRRVLSWRLSNSMDTDFCVQALTEALEALGRPEIFNTDQGSQFTSDDFTSILRTHGVKISMDDKGRCIDNVFVERLWRSLKYEEVYLNDYGTIAEARPAIGRYFEFFNEKRPHAALGYQTPMSFYGSLKGKTS